MRRRVLFGAAVVAGLPVLASAGCGSLLGYDDLRFGAADAAPLDGTIADSALEDAALDGASDGSADAAPRDGSADATVTPDAGGPCTRDSCSANAYCDPAPGRCTCRPGYASNGGDCRPIAPTDPSTHRDADVCAEYATSIADVPGDAWTGRAVPACDPGAANVLDEIAIQRRIQLYRWLVGLGPLPLDPGQAAVAQRCAMAVATNPAAGHFIPVSGACRTPDGAAAAQTGLIAVGLAGKPADAVDRWIEDADADRSLEDRRLLLAPALGPSAIGYYAGGTDGADGVCVDGDLLAGTGPRPAWFAFPPPGPFPVKMGAWGLSFHGPKSMQTAQMTLTKKGGAAVPLTRFPLVAGRDGYEAILFKPAAPLEAGVTYVVSVTGYEAAPISWETRPIACP